MSIWRPDPSFYPSPRMAMQAPAERLAYVVTLNPDGDGKPDALCVLDVDPASPGYSRVVGRVDMPNPGDELHHFGWNACSATLCPYAPHPHVERRYLLVPGLRSSRIHIVDTKDDPRAPRIVRARDLSTGARGQRAQVALHRSHRSPRQPREHVVHLGRERHEHQRHRDPFTPQVLHEALEGVPSTGLAPVEVREAAIPHHQRRKLRRHALRVVGGQVGPHHRPIRQLGLLGVLSAVGHSPVQPLRAVSSEGKHRHPEILGGHERTERVADQLQSVAQR